MKTPMLNALAAKNTESPNADLTITADKVAVMVGEARDLKDSHRALASKVTRAAAKENTLAAELSDMRSRLATAENVVTNLSGRVLARRVEDVRALARDVMDKDGPGATLSAAAVLALVDDHDGR